MSNRSTFAALAIVYFSIAGCGPQDSPGDTDNLFQRGSTGIYTNDPNRHPSKAGAGLFTSIDKVVASGSDYNVTLGSRAAQTANTSSGNATYSLYPVTNVTAPNGSLTVTYKYGAVYYTVSGSSVVGLKFPFTVDSVPYTVRFDGVSSFVNDNGTSVPTYRINAKANSLPDTDPATGLSNWQSVCKDHRTGNPINAVLLEQTSWSQPTTTGTAASNFAGWNGATVVQMAISCEDDTISACERWGYAPWDYNSRSTTRSVCGYFYDEDTGYNIYSCQDVTSTTSVLLKKYFSACFFVKRADYCGWGTDAHTQEGNVIELYDKGMPTPMPGHKTLLQSDLTVEARWIQGASCINSTARSLSQYDDIHLCTWGGEFPGQRTAPYCDTTSAAYWDNVAMGSKYIQ